MAKSGPAIAVSILVHAAVLGGLFVRSEASDPALAPPPARSLAAAVAPPFRAALRALELRQERASAVQKARADLAAGNLSLGAFLLETSRIDAEEAGLDLDSATAAQRYRERLSALRAALEAQNDVASAIPKVFGDLRYYGQPGGLPASALVDGGGSCEQVTQIVAAAVFDAGRSKLIGLRYYGGIGEGGAAHITPVALTKKGEIDLMTSLPPAPGGGLARPEDLVEVYARAHGLAAPLPDAESASGSAGSRPDRATQPASSGSAGGAPDPRRPTLFAGFPKNSDRFPGSLPLYAAHAFRDPARDPPSTGEQETNELQAKHCAYFLRIAMLSPPSLDVLTGSDGEVLHVEPRRVPIPLRLEREAVLMRAAETVAERADTDPIDRVMSWGCLAVLGDTAAVDLALAREHALAAEAVAAAKRGRERGKSALAEIVWSGEAGRSAAAKLSTEYGGRAWILLALEGGDRVLFDLVSKSTRENWGRISALGALVVWAPTRERAISFVSTLPLSDEVEVMHEVFHAHDHMRPWISAFTLDGTPAPPGSSAQQFVANYRVFRGLAFRLWEANRPIAEILSALSIEARASRLDEAWEAALLQYLAHNALGLYSQRPRGKEIVGVLLEAATKLPHASLEPLRRRLAYLEQQDELNARTVADAMRLP